MTTFKEIHERLLFSTFINATRRDRYLALLHSKKGRSKLIHRLGHVTVDELEMKYAKRIGKEFHNVYKLADSLVALGAPSTCFSVSAIRAIDGKELPLTEALDIVLATGIGAFVSCVAGGLAYFQGEDADDRFICHKPGIAKTGI